MQGSPIRPVVVSRPLGVSSARTADCRLAQWISSAARPRGIARERVPEHCVDDQVAVRRVVGESDPHGFEDAGLVGGDGGHLVDRLGKCHRYPDTAVGEMAGRRQATASVASRTGQHRHRRRGVALDRQPCQVAPGVLHHLQQLDAEVLDHDPVYLAHLVGGDRRDLAHRSSNPPRSGRLTSGRLRLVMVACATRGAVPD